MSKKLTTDEFIERAKKIHSDKYIYDNVEYVNTDIKVKIYCIKCEEYFYQTPHEHLNNHGCSNCKKQTKEEFIKKATEFHGDKYDYDEVEYINNYTKVKIYCKRCEEYFLQTPKSHLKCDCLICSRRTNLSIETLIEKSIKIHGDKYVYDDVEYVNNHTKVKIYCKKCEEYFFQSFGKHIDRKQGCPICNSIKFSKEDFIEKAIKIHGDKYNYDDVDYINTKTKVKIYCTKCEEYFYQTPANHFKYNCYNCNKKILRINTIKNIEENKLGGYQITPNYNKNACKIFDEIMLKENIFIQHAMNGGEFHIKELGYWVDGYDKENNTVYEFDEKHHNKTKQKEKDKIRQQEIEKFLGCKFIRIKE